MIRLGLCCLFRDQPIKFVTTTAAACCKLSRKDALLKLSQLCLTNAEALRETLQYCREQGIGCFRLTSQILPLKTHPQHGYELADLPHGAEILDRFQQCGRLAGQHGVRLCFHPDQFVVLNSQRPEVVAASIHELEYQAEVAEWIGADVINIHGGGAFGDKRKALDDFVRGVDRLSTRVRSRLTVENDDRLYSPADLLPVCQATGIPLVYDVHHHRCHGDDLSEEAATELSLATWNREPLFHISSPLAGWQGPKPERHHDFIDPRDFPRCWRALDLTVEVEAKAKEVAVLQLLATLHQRKPRRTSRINQRRV